jgi:lactoylglutathione lyase
LEVGRRIQSLRIKNSLSQEAFAELLGVTRQSVSKWELAQSLPDIEKVVQISRLFGVSTDSLLMDESLVYAKPNKQRLCFGMYLIVKDFEKSIDFYEKLLSMRVSTLNPDRFAQFFFDGIAYSLMNESNLPGQDYSGNCRFVFNPWIYNLSAEHTRVKSLNIGPVTEIMHAHTDYYFFEVCDPDGNVIEITGQYKYEGDALMSNLNEIPECQSCAMQMTKAEDFGTEADGSRNSDYCCHCWKNGGFTTEHTFEEAVEGNIPWWREEGDKSDDEARARIMEVFPKLKRWAT